MPPEAEGQRDRRRLSIAGFVQQFNGGRQQHQQQQQTSAAARGAGGSRRTSLAGASIKDVELGSGATPLARDSLDSVASSGTDVGRTSNRLQRVSSSSGHGGQGLGVTSYSRGVMHQRAADKFQQLNTTYKSRKELQELEQVPRWIVHPHDILAQCWWTFILATVLVTLFVEPYSLAFSAYPGLHPITAPDTILAIIFMAAYASDVCLNFLVAYYDDGGLVTDMRSIAAHYARWRLWVDLMTTIPFDWIVLGALGLQDSNSTLAWYISLLRLLRLGRAYRLFAWVKVITYNQTLSLVAVTLIRNFALSFFVVHWGACLFYYIAKQSGFADTSWVGAAADWIGGANAVERYVYSVYWSVITFATVGYGDFHAYSVPEAVFTIFYVFINIGVAAYIVGTITLLVVRGDEKTGAYRQSLSVLDAYSATHEIPRGLKHEMKGHLRLHFSSSESSDEAVLAVYPTNIRRRILRHLYNNALHSCWLFQGCNQKFLDALLAAAKVELYMPKVDILTEGDHVNELYLIVAGQALAERGSSLATTGNPEGLLLHSDSSSVHGGSHRQLGAGDPAGEMSFFTETTCMESVHTLGMCRVLVIPRTVFNAVAADFPLSISALMNNLVAHAEEAVTLEFPGLAGGDVVGQLEGSDLQGLGVKYASAETVPQPRVMGNTLAAAGATGAASSNQHPLPVLDSSGLPLRYGQQLAVANLLRVRALVEQTRARLEQQRTHEFLNACASGNTDRIRVMLQQGCDVNCCDYDGRTGLMLAAAKGHDLAVKQLLVSGATVNSRDNQGGTALLEAVKAGHDDTITLLMSFGGHLMMSGVMTAAHLCTAVFDGDLQLIRRLLRAGASATAADYDRRTALHIAAADGTLPVVKLLIEEGGADPAAQDRWQQTPLDEAWRVRAMPVVEYLRTRVSEAAYEESAVKLQTWQAQEMLAAASKGLEASVQRLLERGCPPDACDYDKRTGLMLAAANGQAGVVSLLLSAGANPNARDNLGGSPLLEAVKAGHAAVLGQLVAAGASLQLSDSELASALCAMVLEGDEELLRRYIAAGAAVSVGDYDRRTPLHIAAAEGRIDMVKLLVSSSASLTAVDRWGATPATEARRVGATEVAAFLRNCV